MEWHNDPNKPPIEPFSVLKKTQPLDPLNEAGDRDLIYENELANVISMARKRALKRQAKAALDPVTGQPIETEPSDNEIPSHQVVDGVPF